MNIRNLSLSTLERAYGRGTLTPEKLILSLREQALSQVEFNAWITLLDEQQIAGYLARLKERDVREWPLYGIPFAIKDNIDLAGVPTTAACPNFSYLPVRSAPVVQCLLDAGAIPLGKTNLDQFATGLVGTRSPYGETRNAFNSDYISGGSSSGSAVATALGQVSFALGTDTAGSGRVPAALNNLVGHKPTRGLLSLRGVVPACQSLDCVSLLALNCDDAAILLDITARFDDEHPYSRERHYANRLRYYTTRNIGGFRFGLPENCEFDGDAETQRLFEHGVEQLCALGGTPHPIPFEPFLEAAALLYDGPWVAERWLATQQVDAMSMLPVIRRIIKGAESLSATSAFAAQYRLAALKRRCDALISDLDFVITPTTPTFYTRAQLAEKPVELNSALGTYTNFMNLLDYCATALPVGFTASGVPWGVTLFAPANQDIQLLGYASKLHRACALPQGATGHPLPEPMLSATQAIPQRRMELVVCGAHLQGQPLNWQLAERGGKLLERTTTSACYRLYALSDGKRPALVREVDSGREIQVEVWSLPSESVGSFVAGIPEPLAVGKVELKDGRWLSGFVCAQSGLGSAMDITGFGGWSAWLAGRC